MPPPALRITNGRLVDPEQGLDRSLGELLVENGRVVRSLSDGARPRTIDAEGGVVMAGAVDMHCHVASGGINLARRLQAPGDGAPVVPSTRETGRRYARLGYTTVVEAAVAPSETAHAHRQLRRIPNLDTGLLVVLDNHDLLLRAIARGEEEVAAAAARALLRGSGALGMKAVNPAGVAAWRHDPARTQMEGPTDPIPAGPAAGARPVDVLRALADTADALALPHPLHVHANRLGEPGSAETLRATLDALADRRVHIAHVQFYAFGRSGAGGHASAVESVLEALRRHDRASADLGLVDFGEAMTVSCDTPLEHRLAEAAGTPTRPQLFREIEQETGTGVMSTAYRRHHPIHALQWATGLELALAASADESLGRLALSVDHPNGASFERLPQLAALLMDPSTRERQLARAHRQARRRSGLAAAPPSLTLSDIAMLTRAGPARHLGLARKGHLAPGADADLVIYDDHSDAPDAMLTAPRTVIKDGTVLIEDHEWRAEVSGRVLAAPVEADAEGERLVRQWLAERGRCSRAPWGLTENERAELAKAGNE